MADTTRTRNSNNEKSLIPFDERTRRVMELRKQVREGTYRPEPQAVAEALMREWGLVGELLEEVAAPMPAVATANERRAAAAGRFVIERVNPASEATKAHAV